MSARTRSAAPTPAQWALSRMLEAAFDDADSAARCIELALVGAGRHTVPESVEDLLDFGREHLCPILAEELGPRIVQALFDDLIAELNALRRSDTRVSALRPLESGISGLAGGNLPTIQSPAPSEDDGVRKVIALVERDRWTRAAVARVLVQSGFDVLPLDTTDDLSEVEVDAVVVVGQSQSVRHATTIAIPRDASSAQIAEVVRRAL